MMARLVKAAANARLIAPSCRILCWIMMLASNPVAVRAQDNPAPPLAAGTTQEGAFSSIELWLAGAIIVFTTLISEMSTTVMLYSARWKTLSIAIYERLETQETQAAAAIGTITIAVTLLLVFSATRVIGKSMADLFR